MKNNRLKKLLSFVLCILLIAAMAVMTNGCAKDNAPSNDIEITKTLGEGQTEFTFTVTDADGNTEGYKILTDKTTVGDALLEHGLIAGDEGEYGLYVKTVAGKTYDYDKDGKYWAFYVGDAYATSGVDKTDITAGTEYAFKAE